MLRKPDPIGLLHIGQATEYPPRGEETKSEVVQNSENCCPWRVKGLSDLAGGRMRLLLKKSENRITNIVLRGPPWTLIILDSLKAQHILVITSGAVIPAV
jgi:hypothetical protein